MQRSLIGIVGTACIGFVDATYLTIAHYTQIAVPCSITHGCETVLHSSYSMIGPVPLAAFGILFYLCIGFIGLFLLSAPRISRNHIYLLQAIGVCGALSSIGFESLQIFVIHAICQYCALSALCTFVMAFLVFRIKATD